MQAYLALEGHLFTAAWVILLLALMIFGWRFGYRVSRNPLRHPISLRSLLSTKKNETEISPVLFVQKESSRELIRRWLENSDWLEAYWHQEDLSMEEIKVDLNRAWRYHPLHPRETDYLARMDFPIDRSQMRRGKFYDIMGLREMPMASHAYQLQFFGVQKKGMNRTLAEREVRWLMESKINAKIWEERPIDPIQSVFFKLIDIKAPKDIRATQAQAIIEHFLSCDLNDEDSVRADWVAFESIYADITSEHSLIARGIRQPKPETVCQAFESLLREGKSSMDQYIQIDMVVKRCIEIEPSLALAPTQKTQ